VRIVFSSSSRECEEFKGASTFENRGTVGIIFHETNFTFFTPNENCNASCIVDFLFIYLFYSLSRDGKLLIIVESDSKTIAVDEHEGLQRLNDENK
jgi:hypothetical protein